MRYGCRCSRLLLGDGLRGISGLKLPRDRGDHNVRAAVAQQTGAQPPLAIGVHQVAPPALLHEFGQDDRNRTARRVALCVLDGA